MPKIFEGGMDFGCFVALGCLRRGAEGFGIGGPESAGGANLFVGWREKCHEEEQTAWVKHEMGTKAFCRRWQDDVIIVEDTRMSKPTRDAMKERKKKGVYGGDLELEEEKGQDTAFGYEWSTRGGILRCRA